MSPESEDRELSPYDIAAAKAEAELKKHVEKWTVKDLATWWKKHYLAAGHKRLGRIIAKLA